jgi:hypothetical protein
MGVGGALLAAAMIAVAMTVLVASVPLRLAIFGRGDVDGDRRGADEISDSLLFDSHHHRVWSDERLDPRL